jgi:Na+-transporting methylmalonyl-CoA/oxaloacetate decarboxylase gamma subunit
LGSILEGLSLSLAGILITFIYFGLMILVMVLLREIFKVSPPEVEATQEGTDQDIERRKVAAIAVAIAMLQSRQEKDASLGQLLASPPGRWWKDSS